ncbi:hypothetical protein ACF8FL_04830 [Vibrio sp. zbq_19]|uniref:hypothetical protein n=1 Tax=Vibrio sp. zbq_19 TaxID=3367252 RepID=UPI00370C51E1|nr:hypothetical protein [Vibrio parahaemolyticus]EKA4544259.1 hypothetical protein [Vibrio parahaemolyticus]
MHIAAETKANGLLADVLEYITTDTPLNEMAKARFVKAAKELPSYEQSLSILALIYTASGDKEKAKSLCLECLDFFEHPATFNNSLTTLAINGFPKTLLSLALDTVDNVGQSGLIYAYELIVDCLPNYHICSTLFDVLKKCNLIETYEGMYKRLLFMKEVMEHGHKTLRIPLETFGSVSDFAAQIVEQNPHLVLNKCRMSISHEGDYISLVYFVEIESEEVLTADLNWDLGEKIIEANLDTLPLVARFESVRGTMIKMREAYAG